MFMAFVALYILLTPKEEEHVILLGHLKVKSFAHRKGSPSGRFTTNVFCISIESNLLMHLQKRLRHTDT